ncbi:ABC transporter permease [Halalkalibacter okhensis]|uniref:Multidrug ABC transporter permease n=1 Tax=Halalkalibacter okhensis TaxID=333138 RepID=A0A0B0IK21_9BACI|nr:ABC transporter permease [Halalkalibacter okhensis]KHF41675.1 multidrug ABC transporter permease [Halalkalibacter okhensis]
MTSIFLLQWQRFRRMPFLVLSFFGLTIVFIFFIAGFGFDRQVTINTYAEPSLEEEDRDKWLSLLNQSDVYQFEWTDEQEVRNSLATGDSNFALQLQEDDYRFLVATDEANRLLVESYVQQIFYEELRLQKAEQLATIPEFRKEVERLSQEPVIAVSTAYLEGNASTNHERLQVLFGMTLFFSIYTIMYTLMNVADEKRGGTWDRIIVSPLQKWQMYLGHLLYCFAIGYAQILVVFLIFNWGFGFDLGERFGYLLVVIACYVFAIVSLGILLMGLVKSSQQLQVAIPIVASAMAMLGGAYWPIEVVTNDIMLLLSKGMPIYYGMEALKGVVLFDRGLVELMQPLSILALFGVVCMGVGINLMERR